MEVSMQGDQLCVSFSPDDREGPAYLGKENTFPEPDSDGCANFLQTSPDSYGKAIQDLCYLEETKHQIPSIQHCEKTQLPRWWNHGLGRDLTWLLHWRACAPGRNCGVRYWDEILDPYVRPYAGALGNDFILMGDNARPHRAAVVEEYLEVLGLERMEWPTRSPHLNPIEHLWDYLGIQVAALSPPPRSSGELEQSLLRVWSSLTISITDNLIDSMESRCRQCIQARDGHIRY